MCMVEPDKKNNAMAVFRFNQTGNSAPSSDYSQYEIKAGNIYRVQFNMSKSLDIL